MSPKTACFVFIRNRRVQIQKLEHYVVCSNATFAQLPCLIHLQFQNKNLQHAQTDVSQTKNNAIFQTETDRVYYEKCYVWCVVFVCLAANIDHM
jgi:hypothetical protein